MVKVSSRTPRIILGLHGLTGTMGFIIISTLKLKATREANQTPSNNDINKQRRCPIPRLHRQQCRLIIPSKQQSQFWRSRRSSSRNFQCRSRRRRRFHNNNTTQQQWWYLNSLHFSQPISSRWWRRSDLTRLTN